MATREYKEYMHEIKTTKIILMKSIFHDDIVNVLYLLDFQLEDCVMKQG